MSSIGAVVELARITRGRVTLPKFRPYMCCLLLYRRDLKQKVLDPKQVGPFQEP